MVLFAKWSLLLHNYLFIHRVTGLQHYAQVMQIIFIQPPHQIFQLDFDQTFEFVIKYLSVMKKNIFEMPPL